MCFNSNNIGIGGMLPGMGIGNLAPGSKVKFTQTTTGGAPSVFCGRNFYQGGFFGGSNTTSINIQNGPSGFWGGALGFLDGLSGRCRTGWNNMCNGWNNMIGNWGMNNGYNMRMPSYTAGLNLGGTSSLTGSTQTNPLLSNLNTLGGGKWQIVDNYDGTFTAKLDGQYTEDGEPVFIKAEDYATVQEKIGNTKIKASAASTASSETETAV